MALPLSRRLAACAVAAIAPLLAQTEKAHLTGAVTDSTNAAVVGARVALTNVGTGIRRTADTNETGRYSVPFLDPGTYDVLVQKEGFRSISRGGVKLDVAQVANIDFALEIGTVTETINVSAQAPLLDSASASLAHLIDNQRISELPLSGRNAYSFAALVPGVRTSRGFTRVAYDMYSDQFVSINGSRANQNSFFIDGGTNTTAGFNGPGLFPSVDMVAEYKVQTNNFSAEFGNTSGGVVNVVTKGGTNQFHGSLFEFLRNDKFNANDFFLNRAGRPRPPFRFNQFGGTLGGPIRRNRTFFFGAYEGLRWSRSIIAQGGLPTTPQRQGDFSQTRNQGGQMILVYDPLTSRADPARHGRFLRTPFAGNVIPGNRFDPVARNLIRHTPLPNAAGNPITNANNFLSGHSSSINKDTWSVRVDHSFTDNHKTFFRYSANDTENLRPDLYGGEFRLSTPVAGNDTLLQRQVTLNHTGVLRPNLIVELSSSFLRYHIQRASPGLNYDPTQLGFPASYRSLPLTPCFPAVSVTGMGVTVNTPDIGGGFLGSCGQLGNSFDTFQQSGGATYIRGAHTLKAGFAASTSRWSARNFFLATHNYAFSPAFTQGPDPLAASGGAGFGYASYLLGAGNGQIRSDGPGQNLQTVTWGVYLQDDWRVHSKLTLNLGVRYDQPRPWTERFNRVTSWCGDCSVPLQAAGLSLRGALAFPGVDGRSRGLYDSDNNNFAPRFGFAYSVNARTVLRGGYGIFFGPVQGGAVNNASTPRSGFEAFTQWVSSVDGITPTNPMSNAYPAGFERAPGSSAGLLTLLGQNVTMMDPDRQTPYAQQWNLSVQRNLPGNFVLEVDYAGSRGLHLFGPLEFNQLPNQFLSQGDDLRTLVDNPFFGIVRTGALSERRVQRGQLLRPFPQFTGVLAGNSSYGASTYHAVQARMERRFSAGFSLMASYTLSRVSDDVGASTAGGGFPGEDFGNAGLQDFESRRLERAPAQFDTPHNLAINGIWELPFGPNKRFLHRAGWLGAVAGGWQLNGIATFRSGVPLALRTSSNTLRNFGGGQRPNWNGQEFRGEGPISQRLDRYFNTAAFSLPAPYTYGNVARLASWLRAPGAANVDLSLAKNISVSERVRLQFRFESFNTFNRTEFGFPNTLLGSPAAGVISTQVNSPRDIQLGLKLLF